MKTVYIAGKITGEERYKEIFGAAKARLQQAGYVVLSPADLPDTGFSYGQYMRICKTMLMECDTVCMLPNWSDSPGAKEARNLAYNLGKRVVYLAKADLGGEQNWLN